MNDRAPLPASENFAARFAHARARIDAFKPGVTEDPTLVADVTELLEAFAPNDVVDERVQLAWDVLIKAVVSEDEPHAAFRMMCAAAPTGCAFRDLALKRRWMSVVAVLLMFMGRIADAVRFYSEAFDLAERINDRVGTANALGNISLLYAGAGAYDRQLQLCDAVLDLQAGNGVLTAELLRATSMNRANALVRLGRVGEASESIAISLAITSAGRRGRSSRVVAICQLAELLVSQGKASLAKGLRDDLRLDGNDGRAAAMNVQRIDGLLAIAEGRAEEGVRMLENIALSEEPETHDGPIADALYALARHFRSRGESERADFYMRRIAERRLRIREHFIDALKANPVLAGIMPLDDRPAAAVGANRRSDSDWEQVIATAALGSSPEDPSLEHGLRVGRLAALLAERRGLERDLVGQLQIAGLVHDIGLWGVPPEILTKTGDLTDAERSLYDAHAADGAALVERYGLPESRVVVNATRYHHAAYDGLGGDAQVAGDALPLEARILALCDAFDTAIVGRPRQSAVTVAQALKDILARRGRDYDPKLTDAFIALVRDLNRQHTDLVAFLAEDADDIDFFRTQRTLRRATAAAASDPSQ